MADKQPEQVTIFATTDFRGKSIRFGIKQDDRRRHMYLIGKTGMGKSTMLENMVIQDIMNDNGVCYVDPHGDTVEKILDFIPSYRVNDVIYFNPADTAFPIAFNILESVHEEYKHLVANGLVGVFKKIWADSWGPRLEYILMNSIHALLEYPGSTLLGVMRILVDKKFRKKVVEKITDPVVRSFWVDEFANYNEKFRAEAIAPIQNKIGQFLSSTIIRNIVGQPQSSMDMRDIMDSRKILLINLSKGRIGEENSALLGAMMITKIQIAAMSRVDILEEERKDFYLYVDEFQNFATESFADILSEARKYRLNLIMAHQYIEQLDEAVQAAVFGNVGTLIVFRIGAADAEILEPEFMPVFEQNDLVNIKKFNIYLKLMIDGVSSPAFSATTLPPMYQREGNKEKVVAISRERYSKSKEIVEERILRWSGVEEVHEETAKQENINVGEDRPRRRPDQPRPRDRDRDHDRDRDRDRGQQPPRIKVNPTAQQASARSQDQSIQPQAQPMPRAEAPQQQSQENRQPSPQSSPMIQGRPQQQEGGMPGSGKRRRRRRKKKGRGGGGGGNGEGQRPNVQQPAQQSQQPQPRPHGEPQPQRQQTQLHPGPEAAPSQESASTQPMPQTPEKPTQESAPSLPPQSTPLSEKKGLQPGQVIRFD
ncbi:MAG: type IV secretion system DNA-binding domain-containing protein [Candidatus Kerfeldbacteria bacterium]|nr:type IV secretion system DNA-binding domain-containing protein [Candidatus Kerfeldbacteria bacterium]